MASFYLITNHQKRRVHSRPRFLELRKREPDQIRCRKPVDPLCDVDEAVVPRPSVGLRGPRCGTGGAFDSRYRHDRQRLFLQLDGSEHHVYLVQFRNRLGRLRQGTAGRLLETRRDRDWKRPGLGLCPHHISQGNDPRRELAGW